MKKIKLLKKLMLFIFLISLIAMIFSSQLPVIHTLKQLWNEYIYSNSHFEIIKSIWESKLVLEVKKNWFTVSKYTLLLYVILSFFSKKVTRTWSDPRASFYYIKAAYQEFVRSFTDVDTSNNKLLYVVAANRSAVAFSEVFDMTKLKKLSLGSYISANSQSQYVINNVPIDMANLSVEISNPSISVRIRQTVKLLNENEAVNVYVNDEGNILFEKEGNTLFLTLTALP